LKIDPQDNPEDLAAASVQAAREAGLVKPGDRVVLTAGLPFWKPGTTNLIRVMEA
jgi:pyruvate kinase